MTDTRPAILETVTERSRTLSETLRELRAFKTTVEEYQDRVDNMSTNERELFYQSTTSIQTDVIETTDFAFHLVVSIPLNRRQPSRFVDGGQGHNSQNM